MRMQKYLSDMGAARLLLQRKVIWEIRFFRKIRSTKSEIRNNIECSKYEFSKRKRWTQPFQT